MNALGATRWTLPHCRLLLVVLLVHFPEQVRFKVRTNASDIDWWWSVHQRAAGASKFLDPPCVVDEASLSMSIKVNVRCGPVLLSSSWFLRSVVSPTGRPVGCF